MKTYISTKKSLKQSLANAKDFAKQAGIEIKSTVLAELVAKILFFKNWNEALFSSSQVFDKSFNKSTVLIEFTRKTDVSDVKKKCENYAKKSLFDIAGSVGDWEQINETKISFMMDNLKVKKNGLTFLFMVASELQNIKKMQRSSIRVEVEDWSLPRNSKKVKVYLYTHPSVTSGLYLEFKDADRRAVANAFWGEDDQDWEDLASISETELTMTRQQFEELPEFESY